MGLSVRDWMVIVGVLLVVAVLLDGYRRMRQEWRSQIRTSLSKAGSDKDGVDANSELPNGGARVVTRSERRAARVEPRMGYATDPLHGKTTRASRRENKRSHRDSAAGDDVDHADAAAFQAHTTDIDVGNALDTDAAAPADRGVEAMDGGLARGEPDPREYNDERDPYAQHEAQHQPYSDPTEPVAPSFDASGPLYPAEPGSARPASARAEDRDTDGREDWHGWDSEASGDSYRAAADVDPTAAVGGGDETRQARDTWSASQLSMESSAAEPLPVRQSAGRTVDDPASTFESPDEAPVLGPADEVLVINVLAKDQPFAGPELLQILLTCDLRFGKMNIFHRYEQAGGKGPLQFSVANIVEPGVFNLDRIDDFTTRGVCFFLTLPGPQEPLVAFNYMVETAQCLVRNLNGELRDEAHSVMTAQTLEHCRARIREFERRQLTRPPR